MISYDTFLDQAIEREYGGCRECVACDCVLDAKSLVTGNGNVCDRCVDKEELVQLREELQATKASLYAERAEFRRVSVALNNVLDRIFKLENAS